MYVKQMLAGSLALVVIALACPVALAEGTTTPAGGSLQLSPNTTTTVSYAQQPLSSPSSTEDVALRGHLATIPKGTILMIKIDHPISSYSSKVSDVVTAVVESDVYVDNQIVVPIGSVIEGAITGVIPAARMGKHGEMEIQFHAIKTPNGSVIPLRAHIVTADETGIIRGDTEQARVMKSLGTAAGITGAGTVLGTAAGSLMGSVGGGAAFGLAVGGLAGIGYAVTREGKQVVIPSGARMSIVLDQSVNAN